MKRRTNKILSLLLSLIMILSALSLAAVSTSALTSGDYEYEILSDGTIEITKYNGSAIYLSMPYKIAGYVVSSIGDSAFAYNTALEELDLPSDVTNIGYFAFGGCTALKEVKLPSGLESIGTYAFLTCYSLKSVNVPKSVTDLDAYAFGFFYNGHNYEVYKGFMIYGCKNSAAEKYCTDFSVPFTCIDWFPDINKGDWYEEAALYCSGKLFITGYKDGRFGPADPLQRQDFVVILARIAGANLDSYTSCKLTDVDMSSYYGKSVAWAVDKGIITGYNNGKFGVGDKITREQVATILYRYMGSPYVPDVIGLRTLFSDGTQVSEFAQAAMAWAAQNGIISGKNGKLAPQDNASRAEIATIVMRMDKQGLFNVT